MSQVWCWLPKGREETISFSINLIRITSFILHFTFGICYCFSHGSTAAASSLHCERMEADTEVAHPRTGSTLADVDALQLGTSGWHDALFSRGCEKKRSPLSGSCGRSRGDSRTAWLPTVVAGYRVGRSPRSRPFRFSKKWLVGIDCAFARHRTAPTEDGGW